MTDQSVILNVGLVQVKRTRPTASTCSSPGSAITARGPPGHRTDLPAGFSLGPRRSRGGRADL